MNKRLLTAIISAVLIAINAKAQLTYDLAFGLGLNANDQGVAMTADASGNFYCTGYHTYYMNANPLGTPYTIYSYGGINQNIYVAKYNPQGIMQWAFDLGSSADDEALQIALDAGNNVYIAGYYQDTLNFNPHTGSPASRISSGGLNIFLAKYDDNGNFLWANTFGGTGNDQANDVTVNPITGSVIITGVYTSTSVNMDPSGTHVINNNGVSGAGNCFLAAYNGSTGAYEWAYSIGGYNGAEGTRVTTDNGGNIYLGGELSDDSANFNPAGPDTFWVYSNGGGAKFLASYNDTGAIIWANSTNGNGGITAGGLVADNVGNVYQSGYYNAALAPGDSINFNPNGNWWMFTTGYQTAYVAKYNAANGNFEWAFSYGGGDNSEVAQDIALDGNGHLFTTGNFQDTVNFNPGNGVNNLYSPTGTSGGYLAEYDTGGHYIDAIGFTSTTGTQFGAGVCYINRNKVGVTGFFSADTINFGTGSTVHDLYVNGQDQTFTDAFVAVYSYGDTSNPLVCCGPLPDMFAVFPNPTSDAISVIDLGISTIEQISIYDISGHEVYPSAEQPSGGSTYLHIDCSKWEAGLYLIRIKTGNGIKTAKFVKQ